MKYQSLQRRKQRAKSNVDTTQIRQDSVIPNTRYTLPHFGEVKSRHYARLFFDSIGANHGS